MSYNIEHHITTQIEVFLDALNRGDEKTINNSIGHIKKLFKPEFSSTLEVMDKSLNEQLQTIKDQLIYKLLVLRKSN